MYPKTDKRATLESPKHTKSPKCTIRNTRHPVCRSAATESFESWRAPSTGLVCMWHVIPIL
ncbi:hypothetical protein DPMN_105539 [Dreissena polymorpha]|uniref:Uncharacterized protein n=1 Tax=Dreissena polymorpha TaxID=45954 RepID=A0A9D4QHL5_DREPO|nr:hypothetical protein DPMN_105539 [Dreissena polymorpha]